MKVSVVIPTLNAGPEFEELLERISAQEGDFEREIVVIDSGSTDGTVGLANRYGANVHSIPKLEFNHGGTRNLGISLASGEYVALIVQDAVPIDRRWLAEMVEDLERDDRVAGVYSRQVPYTGASVLTRAIVNSLPTAGRERREQFAGSPERYHQLPSEERRSLATFDNVSSCLRRSVWEELPFEKTNFAEDLRWGHRAVSAGYKIVYEPRSAVFHSHERGVIYDLRRNYVNQLVVSELFGLVLAPNLLRLLVAFAASSLHVCYLLHREMKTNKGRPRLRDELKILPLALKHVVPAQVGAYLGVKSHRIAKFSPGLHRRTHRYLSKGI